MGTAQTRQHSQGERPHDTGAFAWLRGLGPRGRRAFGGAFGGYALDPYDFLALPLSMVAIAAHFGLDKGRTGLLTTVTPVVSAIGCALAGAVFPTLVGFLAGGRGVGGAPVFGAVGHGLAVLALFGLPETRGRELV